MPPDNIDTTPSAENRGKTNHELQQEAEAKRAEQGLTVGDGKGFNITNSDGAFSKIPESPGEAQQSLQQDRIDMANARGVAEARGNQTLTDSQGNKMNGMLETRPGGKQYFTQANEDGTWTRSEVLKDNHGNQYLRPVDDKDRPIAGTKTTPLRTTDAGAGGGTNQPGARGNTELPPTAPRDNHQKEFAPPPQRDNSNVTLDASRQNMIANRNTELVNPAPPVVPPAGDNRPGPNPGTVADTTQPVPNQPVKEVSNPTGSPTGTPAGADTNQGNRPAGTRPETPANWGSMTREERQAYRDQIRGQQTDSTVPKSPEVKDSGKPPAPTGDKPGQFTDSFRNMTHQQRTDLLQNPSGQPGGPPRLEGRPGQAGGDKPGNLPGVDGKPGVNLGDRVPGGKPGDARPGEGKPGQIDGTIGGRLDRPGVGKDIPGNLPIDGKLVAQLQALGRSPEGKGQLADLISKFQDGKLTGGGKDAAMADLFKNMKPEQLSGLKAWLTDGNKNPFDFKSLDAKSQQSLSKVFDGMMGGDRMSGKLADLLGDRSRSFDRVPGGDQTRLLLQDLLKGMKDGQLGLGKDISGLGLGKDLSSMLGRNLGLEKGPLEFKLNMNELNGKIMGDLMQRLQNKDFLTSLTGLEKSAAMRLDGKVLGQLGEQTKDGQIAQKQMEGGKEISARTMLEQMNDGKTVNRLTEAVKDLLSKSEVTRALGEKPVDGRVQDAGSQGQRVSDVLSPTRGAGATDDGGADAKTKVRGGSESEEEITKRKQEETKLQEQQLISQKLRDKDEKDRLDREEKERLEKEEKEEEKKRLQRLEEEEKKKKEEEAKKYQDAEFTYTVQDGDTLHGIAGKFSGRTAEIIYARNENSGQIQLQDYKGKKYARVFTGQKLIIPNQKYIDDFKKSTMSYGHINFGKIPYGSKEEELEAWQAGMTAMRQVLNNVPEDDKPANKRSFSSKQASEDERKANVKAALGGGGAAAAGAVKHSVKLGEGLRSIAQKLYNKPSYWRLIAYKNEMPLDTDAKGNPVAQLKRGDQILLPSGDEIAAFDRDADAFLRGEPLAAEPDAVADLVDIELQEVTITDEQPAINFSPETEAKPEEQEQTTITQAIPPAYGEHAEPQSVSHSTAQHPLPKADLSKVEIGFGDEPVDSIWTPNPTPEKLDDVAYIVEAEMLDGDTRGLSFTLQIYSGSEWVTIAEYQIFPHTTFVVKYRRNGERTRTASTLPPKQSMQLARNDFHKNWQNIFREFWRS